MFIISHRYVSQDPTSEVDNIFTGVKNHESHFSSFVFNYTMRSRWTLLPTDCSRRDRWLHQGAQGGRLPSTSLYAPPDQSASSQRLKLQLTLRVRMHHTDEDDDFKNVTEVNMLAEHTLEPTVCTFFEELSGDEEGVVSTVDPKQNLKHAPVSIGRYLCKPGLSFNPLLLRLEAMLAS